MYDYILLVLTRLEWCMHLRFNPFMTTKVSALHCSLIT